MSAGRALQVRVAGLCRVARLLSRCGVVFRGGRALCRCLRGGGGARPLRTGGHLLPVLYHRMGLARFA